MGFEGCITMHTMSSIEGTQLCAVFNDGDDIGFVYSCNNGLGRPEFIARNVPRSGVQGIASTMNFLADRECRPGKTVQSCGLYLMLRSLDKHE
jgi:hypothetical protein